MSKHAKTIRRLEDSVNSLKATIDALSQEQKELKINSWLAAVACLHCDALLELGATLKRRKKPGAADSGASGGPSDSDVAGSEDSAAREKSATVLLRKVRQSNQDKIIVDGSGVLNGTGGVRSDALEWALPELGWSPLRAVESFKSGAADLSTRGLRRALREFAQLAGIMKGRINAGAPDAEECRAALRDSHARVLELIALITVAGDLLVLSEILIEPLNVDDFEPEGGCAAGAAPAAGGGRALQQGRPPPAAEVPAEHWLFAARCLKMGPDQEERVWLLLSGGHQQRTEAIKEDMRKYLEMAAAPGLELSKRDSLLRTMDLIQAGYQVESMVTFLTMAGSLLSVDQMAEYTMGAWPYLPSISGLGKALELIKEQRRAVQNSAASPGRS